MAKNDQAFAEKRSSRVHDPVYKPMQGSVQYRVRNRCGGRCRISEGLYTTDNHVLRIYVPEYA